MSRREVSSISNDQRGQTFIELLTAIFVLSLALVGALGLATSNAHNQVIGASRLVASNLAREGVELARALRDSNWLAELPPDEWDSGLKDPVLSSHCAIIDSASILQFVECKLDANEKPIVIDDLYRIYHADDGSFSQSLTAQNAHGDGTLYYRVIHLDPLCRSAQDETIVPEPDPEKDCTTDNKTKVGVRVTSEVWWLQGSQKYNVKVAEGLTNWR